MFSAAATLTKNSYSSLSYQGNGYKGEWQRVSHRQPCPVCQKTDFCEIARDGQTVHCMRVASAHPTSYRQGGWLHYLQPLRNNITVADLRSTEKVFTKNTETQKEKINVAPVAVRHKAISHLLDKLILSEEHLKYLQTEGFSKEVAYRLGYRTLPRAGRDKLAREIVELVGAEEARGLAFLYEKKGKAGSSYFQFAAARAEILLIPIKDAEGRYLGLKGRWTTIKPGSQEPERAYRILSAGSSGGASLGTPLHIARSVTYINSQDQNQSNHIIITEGEKKADYIALKTGQLCIGVQGTGNWRATGGEGHLVSTLARLKARQVEVAFDADLEKNPRVARDLYQMCCQLQGAGFEVLVRRWPLAAAKGYDDLLRTGLKELARLEKFSPVDDSRSSGSSQVKKFIKLEPETVAVKQLASQHGIRPLWTVAEAREQHVRLFSQLYNEHFFSLGQRRQSIVVTSNPGTGKTHAALAEALRAVSEHPYGRILYLADNKEVYRQWIKPGALLHKAWQEGLVAIREGRQKAAGSFECRKFEECEAAGHQRHAPTWDICATCPFFSNKNWQAYLSKNGMDNNTSMPWNCQQEGYWSGVEKANKARMVLAPKASFLNNSNELSEFDIIILDESPLEHLLEKVVVTRETLAVWRESIQRQASQEEDNEYFYSRWQQHYMPFIRLFELVEQALIRQQEFYQADRQTLRQNLWPFLPTLEVVAAKTGQDLADLIAECRATQVSKQTGRYNWERPFTNLDGSLTFPLHFACELVEGLARELSQKNKDTRLWSGVERKSPALVVFQPREHLLQILRGQSTEEGLEYKNEFASPPSVIILDATPAPLLLEYVMKESCRVVSYEVAQHVEVTQLTNSLYTRDELQASNGKALQEVNRILEQECQHYASSAIFCHKAFNPAAGKGPHKLNITASEETVTWGHFDRDNKALNSLSEVEFIAIVGHYCHPLDQLRAQVQAFRFGSKEEEGQVETDKALWKLRGYNWRDEQGNGIARRCRADYDQDVQQAIEHCERAAILQAIGRGRPTLRSPEKPLQVLLVTSTPLEESLPVKRLAEARELLGESVLSLPQAQALATGRAMRQAQQSRRSEVAQRIVKVLSELAVDSNSSAYLSLRELGWLARAGSWQLKVMGLDKIIRTGDENKSIIGPELFIDIYKQLQSGKAFVFSPVVINYDESGRFKELPEDTNASNQQYSKGQKVDSTASYPA
ncbi:MAG TPA: DUF3854 domain-containing protein [Chloroflexia bacterium]|nr:DUF3854 domain-containing protein [Chloroflexia bacterium]